ncbi:MAG TPA: AsmA-like C-terminal region-containing protein, partial [Burkholderiales bacterium]|nr:AsmA-like C-terminal region-containing protein [Burkholderiales bacterium]
QQEALRKREEEEERRREEEDQARQAMERAEREEQARVEAERREAEDRERRERMERERQDREERERKRQEEKETRIREQEEAKVKREQERQRQEAMKVEAERRDREDDLVRRRKEQEERDRKRAEVDALKKQKGIKTPLERLKPFIIGVVVLVALVLGGIQIVPMNSYVPSIEKLASEHIKEPVSIGSMHISVLSGFTINLQNVKLGTTQDIKIGKVTLTPEFGSVFGEVKLIRKLEAESVTVAEEVLPRLPKWLEAAVADKNVQVGRVQIRGITLESRIAKVPPFDADLQISGEGAIEKAVLASSDGKLNVELTPRDSQIDIALNASKGWVLPVGPQLEFTDLSVKAVANHNQINVEKFEALLYGGAAKGSAQIVWGGPWSIDGDVETERVAMQDLMFVFTRDAKSTGQLESKLHYTLNGQGLATMFDSPKVEGSFDIKKGNLDGVDLVRALQSGGRGVTQGGATSFEEISGSLGLANGRYQYRNMKLTAGLLSATGAFDVSANKDVSGRIAVELRSQAAQIRGNYSVNGDLKAIVLKPN